MPTGRGFNPESNASSLPPSQFPPLNGVTYLPTDIGSIDFGPSVGVSNHDFSFLTSTASGSELTHALDFPAESITNFFSHVDSTLQSELPFFPPDSHGATSPSTGSDSFPSQDRMVELVGIFLDHFDAFLPFFHRASFQDDIRSGDLPRRAPALTYAVLAIAAKSHSDSTIRARHQVWYYKAKTLYEETAHDPHQALQVLQAAACIIFQALMSRDYSVVWLVMGKAWRQAVALGFHRLDGDSIRSPGQAPEPKNLREKEEQRRTMWTLFILDRGMCFPLGLPHAIDDRQFMANLPINDNIFQGTSPIVRLPSYGMLLQMLMTSSLLNLR